MSDEVMENIHEANFRLLLEWDRVCRKHGIGYFLSSGTLLGAVREHGFIPWDDDVDLLIRREDYEKLLQNRNEFGKDFEMILPADYGAHFFDMIPRLVYKNSMLREPKAEDLYYENRNNRVSLDLFIMDSTYDDIRGKIQLFLLKCLYGMGMAWRYKTDDTQYTGFQKAEIAILTALGRRVKMEKIRQLYDRVSIMFSQKKHTKIFVSDSTIKFIDILYDRKIFAQKMDVSINDHAFPAPNGYDEYLTSLYGDYMVPPPKEQRQAGHAKLAEVRIW